MDENGGVNLRPSVLGAWPRNGQSRSNIIEVTARTAKNRLPFPLGSQRLLILVRQDEFISL